MRLTPRSLQGRLLLGAAIWGLLALALTELLLLYTARGQMEAQLRQRLSADLDQLLAASAARPDGGLAIERELSDPLYQRVFSGHYWQVARDDAVVARSRSLWDQALPSHASVGAHARPAYLSGPRGQSLLALTRQVTLPRLEGTVRLTVASDLNDVEASMQRFGLVLTAGFGALALGLVLAAVLQVRLGLRPLRRLRDELIAIRRADTKVLAGEYPSEVAPLVADMNAVLRDNQTLIERARSRAGNLAHALKTPLSVLGNEAHQQRRHGQTALAERLQQVTDEMQRDIDWHLAHARIAAVNRPDARTLLSPVLARLQRTLSRLFHEQRIEVSPMPELAFRGEAQDLEQMLGNLMENACKWASRQVTVTAHGQGEQLEIVIEDDGPGLAVEARDNVLHRGRRLDESMPGSGLGLSIVLELTDLYGGSLALGSSSAGGLSARLRLPAAG
ncbi:MAG: sensor histidine kinase [Salinisphaeraceae bacterium]